MKIKFVQRQINDFIKPEEFGLFYHIITNDVISNAISCGGWIAGGFAHAILSGESLITYLYPEDPGKNRAGDIDIFFPNQECVNRANESISITLGLRNKNKISPQFRFATDWPLRRKRSCVEHLEKLGVNLERLRDTPVQYVSNPPDGFKTTLRQTLSDFDLVNCMVGIDGTKIIFPENWFKLHESKELLISKNRTPFLGRRLAKYISHRKYQTLSKESRDLFIGWLAFVKNNNFSSNFIDFHFERNMMIKALDSLMNDGVMETKDAIMLIDKWEITLKIKNENYGTTYIQKDWALQHLENLS